MENQRRLAVTDSDAFYVSKFFASIQIPHIQTVLTKRIEVAALDHKMWQFSNCFLQSYMLLVFLFT